jgi:hypothetical protein
MKISENHAGLLIGRSGSTIQKIRALTGCYITMASITVRGGESYREMTLKGTASQLVACKEQITKILNREVMVSLPVPGAPMLGGGPLVEAPSAAGFLFVCTNETLPDCLNKLLFGLPRRFHKDLCTVLVCLWRNVGVLEDR